LVVQLLLKRLATHKMIAREPVRPLSKELQRQGMPGN
jgi:hypothetical protein